MKEQDGIAFAFINVVDLASMDVEEPGFEWEIGGNGFSQHFEIPERLRVSFGQPIPLPKHMGFGQKDRLVKKERLTEALSQPLEAM